MSNEIKNCETHIEVLLDKDKQTKIGINPDDVDHIRPLHQKVLRILVAYNELQDEIKKLKKFKDYSYYVGTEITCGNMPLKYLSWLDSMKEKTCICKSYHQRTGQHIKDCPMSSKPE